MQKNTNDRNKKLRWLSAPFLWIKDHLSYLLIPTLLCSLGVFFIYKHVTVPKTERKKIKRIKFLDKEIKLESTTRVPERKTINIPRKGFYRINVVPLWFAAYPKSLERYPLHISFPNFSILTNKNPLHRLNAFYIEKPGPVTLGFNYAYRENIITKIRFRELGHRPEKYSLILTPSKHHDFTLKASKGMFYKIKKPKELFYIDIFGENNNRLSHNLYPNPKERIPLHTAPYDQSTDTLFFWQDCVIKFQAAEVPFVLNLEGTPIPEKFFVNDVSFGTAQYLDDGEEYYTGLYLDTGDKVNVFNGEFLLTTEEGKWWSEKEYRHCKNTGHLSIKAVGRARVNHIKIKRNKVWNFTVNPDEKYEQIYAYRGDKMSFSSNARYYLNGVIQNKGKHERTFSSHKKVTITGSVLPAQITVKILKRQGI